MKKYFLMATLIVVLQDIPAQSTLQWSVIADNNLVYSAGGNTSTSGSTIPVTGAGRRMMWFADRAAFRVGYVDGIQWNSDKIGMYSFAAGFNANATGINSFAFGKNAAANGENSFALGWGSIAGTNSAALGYNTLASGEYSTALGTSTSAIGNYSFAAGFNTQANGQNSTALGSYVTTNNKMGSFIIGDAAAGTTLFGNDTHNQMMMKFTNGYKLFVHPGNLPFSILPNGTVAIDQSNLNNGNINNSGFIFGNQSGEGIASKRTGGGNQYGLDFYTSFANRMSITNAGNIGIGTSVPGAKFVISTTGEDMGGSAPSKTFRTYSGVLGTNAGAEIKLASFGFKSGNWTSLGITAYRYNGADGWPNAAIVFGYDVDNTPGAGSYFALAGNGNFGIGTAAPGQKLTVAGNILATGSITPSDSRYKKNILPISGALNTVMSLSGFTYLLKTEEFPQMNFESRTQYGLLAQDVETVLPEIVYTGTDGYKGIEYSRIIPLLIEGVKEQQKIIEKQQQQIDELKKMVEAILKK